SIGVQLRAGRTFVDSDGRSEGKRVAIVNETFARRYWRDASEALGKRQRHRFGPKAPWRTVVGVVRDVKDYGLDQPVRPSVFLPQGRGDVPAMTVVLRTSLDPNALVASAREVLRSLDPELPMFHVTTMTQRLEESLWVRRTYSWLLGVFAAVALILAVSGIYGVISYTVSRRTHEIGIRMALGAQQGQVLRHVLREGMLLASIGVALGM